MNRALYRPGRDLGRGTVSSGGRPLYHLLVGVRASLAIGLVSEPSGGAQCKSLVWPPSFWLRRCLVAEVEAMTAAQLTLRHHLRHRPQIKRWVQLPRT